MYSVLFISWQPQGGGGGKTDFLAGTGLKYEKARQESGMEQGVNVYRYSYYDLEDENNYKVNPAFKLQTEHLDRKKTAIVVIDPWCDMVFPKVNKRIAKNVKSYILPIVKLAVRNEIPVYIFTNNPERFDFNTRICEELHEFVDGKNVRLLYYDKVGGTQGFCNMLLDKGIDHLIYMGYASQLCMLYRNAGIMSVWYQSDFNLYVVPEATAAVVDDEESHNTAMRNNICIMLSQQGIAGLIPFKDIINYLD